MSIQIILNFDSAKANFNSFKPHAGIDSCSINFLLCKRCCWQKPTGNQPNKCELQSQDSCLELPVLLKTKSNSPLLSYPFRLMSLLLYLPTHLFEVTV